MRKYYCEVLYRTPAGSPGAFSAYVAAADISAASKEARRLCLKRRKVAKVDGGSAVLIEDKVAA